MHTLSHSAKAIMLLCARLGASNHETCPPLSLAEYNAVAEILHAAGLTPGDLLLETGQAALVNAVLPRKLTLDRIQHLLGRGAALGFELDTLSRQGIAVLCRSEAGYPQRVRAHLKAQAPPLLYCIGDPTLVAGVGLAIVGSRDVDADGLETTQRIASEAVQYGITIVSGGARGVDQTAMMAALNIGGACIGVLADSLLKESLSKRYRQFLAEGRLFLLSPWHPTAGFNVGTAMGRNKLIYAMADHALIISSALKEGGTWAGAEEELKRANHRPVYVHDSTCAENVRAGLLALGAMSFPADFFLHAHEPVRPPAASAGGPTTVADSGADTAPTICIEFPPVGPVPSLPPVGKSGAYDVQAVASDGRVGEPSGTVPASPSFQGRSEGAPSEADGTSILEARILELTVQPMKDSDLAAECTVSLGRMRSILKALVAAGRLARHERPVRYERRAQEGLWGK